MQSRRILSVVTIALALSASSCVDMETLSGGLKAQVEGQNTKVAELQKATNELSAQVKTLNEENNSVKVLLTKVNDHVVAQQSKIDEMDATIKQLQASKSAPSRSTTPPARRR